MSRSQSVWGIAWVVTLGAGAQWGMADAFQPPLCGGWAYSYDGDAAAPGSANHFDALDGTWSFTNGSSSWDQTGPGTGAPGGAAVVTDGGTTCLRIQDTGNPVLYGYTAPANPKINFGHDVTSNISDQLAVRWLDDGLTLSFRARLSTPGAGSPLDQTCPSPLGTRADWPSGGDGCLNGNFTVRQLGNGNPAIRFSLALATDLGEGDVDVMGGKQGLVMNRLKGTSPSKNVRPWVPTDGGTMNILEIQDLTVWHEFWIIIRQSTTGVGTHHVTVYMDGSVTPAGQFDVTASNESEYNTRSYIAMGMPSTGESGSVDVDFFRFRAGAMPPLVGGCLARVLPDIPQRATAVQGFPATSIPYQLTNCDSPEAITYQITVLDQDQLENPVAWLSLDKSSGSLTTGQTDVVTVSFDTSPALANQGLNRAYLRITDGCSPANVQIRPIELNLLRWAAEGCSNLRGHLLDYPDMPIEPVTYVIRNSPAGPMTYSVAKSITADWAVLSSSTGVIPPGGEAAVTVGFNKAALTGDMLGGVTRLDLTFSSTADIDTYTHRLRFRYMGEGTARLLMYDGTSLPQADNSAGQGLRFGLLGDDDGSVQYDPDAQNRASLRILDRAGYSTVYQAQVWNPVSLTYAPLALYSEFGGTVLARLKVSSWSERRGGNLFAWDSDTGAMTASAHWGGSDGLVHELMRDSSTTATGTDGYILVRLATKGRSGFECDNLVSVYLDENPIPVLQIPRATSWLQTLGGLGFGAGSDACVEEIWFDWVTATNAGAFAPGEELATLGRSLIPEFCHVPFADADRDGDVDQMDFAAFQRCLTSEVTLLSDQCECFDRPGPDAPRGDGLIDSLDFNEFERCASGPGIPWSEATMPPGCQP